MSSPMPPAGNLRGFDASSSSHEPDSEGYLICDAQFMRDVEQLKALRSFMIQQAVLLKPSEAGRISLGVLNLLRYGFKGRPPTPREWETLENLTQELYQHLSEPVRRKFLYGQIPAWVVQTAGVLGLIALGSLVGAFISGPKSATIFISFLIWVAALGAVGSIAFIGMNALAVQDDATFDITNTKLITLRIALGALFGAVLSLPVSYASFVRFLDELLGRYSAPDEISAVLSRSILLLLPFILGFSTSLVIMILNRFVEAVQSFFGKKSDLPPAASHAAPVQSPLPVRRVEN